MPLGRRIRARRKHWASLRPFGLGEQRPNNYLEIVKAAWASRRRLPYAWKILNRGVCDGCALGTSGMKDWTLEGPHLCNVRLRLLSLNTMGPLDPAVLRDAGSLAGRRAADLRALGRLPGPMLRRAGEPGFTPVSWDSALDLVAERIQAADPSKVAAFLTSRGMPNESYYVAQKAMRALGVSSIDNAARICHSPSTFGLKEALGVGATTCSYTDLMAADLVVFFGANPANNQPVTMKYLHHAKHNGAKIISVNPYREPGMERYWVPSIPESAVFGTKVTDEWFQVHTGGDTAFVTGVLKHLVERGWVNREFVDGHTTGFEQLRAVTDGAGWDELERVSGLTRDDMARFAAMVHEADRAVLVWSMGMTQHVDGEDNVRAIIDLGLTQGWVGREGCGLMPIRGHSGVQGGAEMGCYSTALPGGVAVDPEGAAHFSQLWGFEVPAAPGLTAPEMIDADLDVLLAAGGSFTEVLPDPAYVERRLARIPLRVHMDLVLSPQMLVEPEGDLLLLPARTRYEIPGGCTQTSTERRVIFSPEIPGSAVPEARAEWEIFGEIAARVRPDLAGAVRFTDTAAVRQDIARAVPMYDGIQHLASKGDQFQYGGRRLCEGWEFPTPDGRARFVALRPRRATDHGDTLRLTTRRGKQFNSMVQEPTDALNGAAREDVLVSADDLLRLGLADGDRVTVRSPHGTLEGTARASALKPGNVQVHWPEGNVLLDRSRRSPEAGVPDYGAGVTLEPLAATP
jgi:molybdopterin-dependent oxidoreductase alpha subunit